MQPLAVQPGKRILRHFSAVGNWFWRHLSLFVIASGWTYSALRRWAPREISGWTLGHLFKIGLLKTAGTWVLVWLLLKHDGQKVSDLGLRKAQLKKSFLPGFLFGLVIFAVSNVFIPWITQNWFSDSESVLTGNWFRSPVAIPVWIFLGLIAGGLTEEVSRAFVLTRFERAFGRVGLIIAIILSSVSFGIGHLYQGHGAAFSLGISGALYALVYLRRRSCWEAVIAHATFDTVGITILFCMYLRRSV
jgi:membrane protease YdiL (CAAX protease family)